jgi:hypothetical protein
MILDIKNCEPSREKVEEAVPFIEAQTVRKHAIPRITQDGLIEARAFRNEVTAFLPMCGARRRTMGIRTTAPMPFTKLRRTVTTVPPGGHTFCVVIPLKSK